MPLPKRDRGVEAAQRTIRDAFEDLQKIISPADARDFADATLESVQKAALDIESQLGMRSSLRNMRRLMPLFSGLHHYSGAIEVLCNGTPYLPWIWAPIKLILKIASDHVEAIEQIIKAYSRIGESLKRFRVLDEAFSKNANFQHTLAVFYADILRFHRQAYTFVRRSCWKVLFLTSWGRFQRRFDNIIDDLKRHEDQIDREANAYHIVEAKESREKLEAWRQDALAKLARDEEEQTAGYLQTICTWLKLDDTDQAAMFDKVSTEGAKYPETCGWILKNPTMASWLKPQLGTPFLWLQGNPGTGKSVIVGKLVNFLRASPKSLVVTHFCTSSYASSTQYDRLLRSLLFQMISVTDDLIAHIYWEYVVAKKTASIAVLEQLLSTVVAPLLCEPSQNLVVHVFLDGLDEFEIEKQHQVVRLMRKVASGAQMRGAVFKVLISCRTSPLLEKLLKKNPVVSLSDEKDSLEEAICLYASYKLAADGHRLSQLGLRASDLAEMGRSIARKADGMFLWARLVLEYLATNIFHHRDEITDAIDTLPRQLSEFYERILTNTIANFDKRSVDRMRQILGWIAFAKRPLRKAEFRSALSFSAGDSRVDRLVPSYVFDMCTPLIEQRRDSSFAFIHVSVKNYLQTPQSKIIITEDIMAQEHCIASVTCLLSGLEVFRPDYLSSSRALRVLNGMHGFQVYATEYWVDYILSIFASNDTLRRSGTLSLVVKDFCTKLDCLSESADAPTNDTMPSEKSLDLLKEHRGLNMSASAALEARSKKGLGEEVGKDFQGSAPGNLKPIKELRDVLANYQATIKSLLLIQDFPGVTLEELELFKKDFRTSANTCRLSSCPRATSGFDTNEFLLEHEATHAPRLQCMHPGCQYPPFLSIRALKNHEVKCHATVDGRKTIRRTAALPQSRRENNTEAVKHERHQGQSHTDTAIISTAGGTPPSSYASINGLTSSQADAITPAQRQALRYATPNHQQESIQMPMLQSQQQQPQAPSPPTTPQENAIIMEIANQLMQQAPVEEKNQVRANVTKRMDPNALHSYAQRNQDPVIVYYRNQVLTRFRNDQKRPLYQDQQQVSRPMDNYFGDSHQQPAQQSFQETWSPNLQPNHSRDVTPAPDSAAGQTEVEWSMLPPQFTTHRRAPSEYADTSANDLDNPSGIIESDQVQSQDNNQEILSGDQQQNATTQIQQVLYDTVSSQTGQLTGWQANVLIQERVGLIFKIIGNLRLASQNTPSPPGLKKMIEIGIKFEREIFHHSPDKNAYKRAVEAKLEQLLEIRHKYQNEWRAQSKVLGPKPSSPSAVPLNLNYEMHEAAATGSASGPQPSEMPVEKVAIIDHRAAHGQQLV